MEQKAKHILLVEDDVSLNNNIREAMLAEGLQVEAVFDGNLAERLLKKRTYDCLVLDINLPGKNGFELCRAFRQFNTSTPVLILTAFDELEDKVTGFESGADDYLTKPFYIRELMLRVNALLKRNRQEGGVKADHILVVSDIVVDMATKKVSRQGQEITLTPREYQILLKLMEAKGELISKQELIKDIWGHSFNANTNTIEVYINFLRKKIDKPFGKESIKTRIGFGYYFEDL